MSEHSTIARPYARAVFELAKETGSLPQWSEDLLLMASVSADERVSSLLGNPSFTREKKADMLITICKGKISPQAENFVKMMSENNRLSVLPEVLALYEQLKSEDEGTVDAELISAFEVTDSQKKAIQSSLQKRFGKDVHLDVSVDKDLIGGAVIKAGDLVIDGSISSRLDKLGSQMVR